MDRIKNALADLLLSIIGASYYQDQRGKPVKLLGAVYEDFFVPDSPGKATLAKANSVSAFVDSDLRDALNAVAGTTEKVDEHASSTIGGLSLGDGQLGNFGDGFGDPPGTNPSDRGNQNPPSSNLTISPSQPNDLQPL